MMQVHSKIVDLRQALKNKPSIAFVPTMGCLHDGHIRLIQEARKRSSTLVVSIFVNPTQFNNSQDLQNYPQSLSRDLEHCEIEGVDYVFAPSIEEIYPQPSLPSIKFLLPPLAQDLCGKFRPHHFEGVLQIVLKLFHIILMNGAIDCFAVFGKKDYQQLCLVKTLVTQFDLPIKIIEVETVREPDGLAMSSRNVLLNSTLRAKASELYLTLQEIKQRLQKESSLNLIETSAMETLTKKGWQMDYIAIRQKDTLQMPSTLNEDRVILGAGYLGNVRLIDNVEVSL